MNLACRRVRVGDGLSKPSVSLNGSSQGTAANKKMYALANDKTASGASFGAWDDDRYVSRELWCFRYDFSGGIARSTDNDESQVFALDYKLAVHAQA